MITHFAFESNQQWEHLQIPRAKDHWPNVKHTSDMHSLEFAHTYPSAMQKALIPTTFLTVWILPHTQTLPSFVRTSVGSWEQSSSICQVGAWVQNKALSAAAASDFSALQYLTRTGETRSHSHLEPLITFFCHRCSFTYVSRWWRCEGLVCSTLDRQPHVICIDTGFLCVARVDFCIFQYSCNIPFEKQHLSLRLG